MTDRDRAGVVARRRTLSRRPRGDSRLGKAEQPPTTLSADAKAASDSALQAASLLCEQGKHSEAVERLANVDRPTATRTLESIMTDFAKSKRMLDFYLLRRQMARSGYRSRIVDNIYLKAFQLSKPYKASNHTGLSAQARLNLIQRTLSFKWPHIPLDFSKSLAALDKFRGPDIVGRPLLNFLCDANGIEADERPAYNRKVLWGCWANILFTDLQYVLSREQVDQIVDRVDFAAFAETIARVRSSGQSVFLVGAHVGLFRLGAKVVRRIDDNPTLIGAGSGSVGDDFMSVEDPQQALFFLVKSLRRPGALGIIAGDAPLGSAKHRTEFLGLEIGLGLGAPFAIYHTKCQPIWHFMAWEDGTLRMRFELGPTVEAGEPYDAWVARWFEFYVAKLRDVATGDPRNIRGGPGIWSLVRTSLREASSAPAGTPTRSRQRIRRAVVA